MANATMLDALELLQSYAPVAWEEWVNTHDATDVQDMALTFEALALHAASFGRYLDYRALGQSHSTSVRAMNTTRVTLRRSLGYSQPKDDLHI
mgnify:CR=1 FL=1